MRGLCFLICLIGAESLNLEQVFVLSRHNLRAPLTGKLQRMTPLPLPIWSTEVAHLTPKGSMLEQSMGNYFNEWLSREGLFTGCPERDEVLIYTNTYQRTVETGRAFAKSTFKNCNTSVLFKNIVGPDPLFYPVILNNTETFKELYVRAMQDKLDSLNLREVYVELDKIIDFNNSEMCKSGELCDLADTKDVIVYERGQEPDVFGPLSVGNAFADSFLMAHYSNKPSEEIAWGKIANRELWAKLLLLTKQNQNVRFNHTLAKDLARPMLNFMKDALLKRHLARKFTMLVGHDSNLNAMMASLNFKSFELPGQHELTPIGGKLVFQKWRHGDYHFLKVNYVYQTEEQLKNAAELSLVNPPNSVVMELRGCAVNEQGFCMWSDFESVLKSVY